MISVEIHVEMVSNTQQLLFFETFDSSVSPFIPY